jgi:hypothetical protein
LLQGRQDAGQAKLTFPERPFEAGEEFSPEYPAENPHWQEEGVAWADPRLVIWRKTAGRDHHALLDGVGRELSVAQQMKLKLANLFRPELIRRLVEVVGEVPQCADVGVYGTLGVITTLELIHHQLS